MLQLAIRCHPCVPVSADELEPWLEKQLDELRADAPHGTLRLSRLTQSAPDTDLEIGWLVELDLPEDEPLLTRAAACRRPQGHAPPRPSANTAGATRSRDQRESGMTVGAAAVHEPALDADSAAWLRALDATGPERDAAVERLHALLLRAAITEAARRRSSTAIAAGDLDDLANQAADDALMAVLRKLHTYRGRQPLHDLGVQVRAARGRRGAAKTAVARARASTRGRGVGAIARRRADVAARAKRKLRS